MLNIRIQNHIYVINAINAHQYYILFQLYVKRIYSTFRCVGFYTHKSYPESE